MYLQEDSYFGRDVELLLTDHLETCDQEKYVSYKERSFLERCYPITSNHHYIIMWLVFAACEQAI